MSLASLLPIFSLLRPSVLDLWSGTGQTDGRTDGHTDGQRDKQRPSIHYPHPMGHNNFSVQAYGSENVGQTNAKLSE